MARALPATVSWLVLGRVLHIAADEFAEDEMFPMYESARGIALYDVVSAEPPTNATNQGPGLPPNVMREVLALKGLVDKRTGNRTTDKASPVVVADCAIHGVQIPISLTNAAMSIYAATKVCPQIGSAMMNKISMVLRTHEVNQMLSEVCGANVASVISTMSSVAATISIMATNCGDTINIKAACAGTVTSLAAALAGIATSANLMAAECNVNETIGSLLTDKKKMAAMHAALNLGKAQEGGGIEITGNKMVSCVANVLNSANNLAAAGVRIKKASTTCHSSEVIDKVGAEFPNGKIFPKLSQAAKSACATNVLSIISAFEGVASSLTLVSGLFCVEAFSWNSIHSVCAAAIIGLINAIEGLATVGLNIGQACNIVAAQGANTVIPYLGHDLRHTLDIIGET
jgi:hypothetical protein